MAVPVFTACHKRLSYPHASFLIHDGELGMGNSTKKVSDQYAYVLKQDEEVKKAIIENTKISPKLLKSKAREEWYFYAKMAVELGVVDEILDITI
jgi:ATP-dependent Clp protease protease subunit